MERDYKNTPEGRRTAQKYADIINLKRPASSRSKMDLTQRAKIFSPFDALRGYDETINEADAKSRRVQKKILSEGELGVLSDKLLQIRKGMTLTVEYFDSDGMGNYRTAYGTVLAIDPVRRTLKIEERQPDTTAGKLEKVLPTEITVPTIADILLLPWLTIKE